MKKIVSVLLIISITLTLNIVSVFATGLVDNFTINFTGMKNIGNGGINLDTSVANNGYYYVDGVKTYAGIEGYYGYHKNLGQKTDFELKTGNSGNIQAASILNYDNSVLQLTPNGDGENFQCSSSFGRYDDLNLSGISVFEFLISTYGSISGLETTVSIVQNKSATTDECAAEYKFLRIDPSRNMYFDGNSESIGILTNSPDWQTAATYYKVTYILDNSGIIPRHSIKITNNSTGQTIANIPFSQINQATAFDFTKESFGIRFMAETSGAQLWSFNQRFLLKSLSFNKPGIFEMTTDTDYYKNNPVKPNTNGQKISVSFEKDIISDTVNTDNIVMTDFNGNKLNISTQCTGSKTIEITAPELESRKLYKIAISGISSTDYSMLKGCELSVGVLDCMEIIGIDKNILTENEIKKVKLDITVKSNLPSSEECIMIITRSNLNGKLRPGIFVKKITVPSTGGTYLFEKIVSDDNLSDTYNIFLWSDISDIKALSLLGVK